MLKECAKLYIILIRSNLIEGLFWLLSCNKELILLELVDNTG